jgi:hypothetical protein
MMARRFAGIGALAAVAVLGAGCLPAYFRQVPPSFVFVDTPAEKVVASPTAATVVVYDAAIDTIAPKQALTLVLRDGTPLGQAPTKAWLSFEVPAGRQTIASGVPEIGDVRPCATHTFTFEAGKIYVLQRTLLAATPDDHPERMISLLTRLRVDRAAAQERVRARWADFWAPCIDKAEQGDRDLDRAIQAGEPNAVAVRELRLKELRPPVAFTELVIPPPP